MPGILRLSKRSKYKVDQSESGKAKRTVDGILFASQREAKRYLVLRGMERSGKIADLTLQTRFPLEVNQVLLGHYQADFTYVLANERVIEDCKGYRTPLYRWKKKHFEAQYGIQIVET